MEYYYQYIKSPLQYKDVPLEFRWYKCKPFNKFIHTTKYDKPYDKEWHRKGVIR